MPSEPDHHRDRGIDLGDLPEKLETISFPVGKDDLLEEFGDHELDLQGGKSPTLSSVLEPAGVTEFESRDELFGTIFHMVGGDAVGQVGQTGRGTSNLTPPEVQRPPGKPEPDEQEDQTL